MNVKAVTNRLKWMLLVLALSLLQSRCGLVGLLNGGEGIAAPGGLTCPIVDTNQSKTYDNSREIRSSMEGEAFYGQDAQHTGNPPRYLDNEDGTVTDLVTGLMWQQAVSAKVLDAEAVAGAETFNLAGYTDWRLPSIKGLYLLIDFSGLDVSPKSSPGSAPFINTDYFHFQYGNLAAGERIIDSQWATSTVYVASSAVMFGVNFADGRIKATPSTWGSCTSCATSGGTRSTARTRSLTTAMVPSPIGRPA